MARGRRRWEQLDLSEKLGYAWAVCFFVLIVGTGGAIIGPHVVEWWNAPPQEEAPEAAPAAVPPPEIVPPVAEPQKG